MLFGNRQSGRRNYAAHGYSSSILVLGYVAYLFFQSPAPLDSLNTVTGTFVRCNVERHHSRHDHGSHVLLQVAPAGGGPLETFELDPSPWPDSQSCAALNSYVGRIISIAHSRNPDPMGYMSANFHDSIWQLQAENGVVVDYPAQVARWQKRSDWMMKFMGGFGLLLLVIALFEHRRGMA